MADSRLPSNPASEVPAEPNDANLLLAHYHYMDRYDHNARIRGMSEWEAEYKNFQLGKLMEKATEQEEGKKMLAKGTEEAEEKDLAAHSAEGGEKICMGKAAGKEQATSVVEEEEEKLKKLMAQVVEKAEKN